MHFSAFIDVSSIINQSKPLVKRRLMELACVPDKTDLTPFYEDFFLYMLHDVIQVKFRKNVPEIYKELWDELSILYKPCFFMKIELHMLKHMCKMSQFYNLRVFLNYETLVVAQCPQIV